LAKAADHRRGLRIVFDGPTVRPVPAEFGDGIVGLGLLGRFDFAMDLKAGKLWLLPRGELHIVAPPAPGTSTAPHVR